MSASTNPTEANPILPTGLNELIDQWRVQNGTPGLGVAVRYQGQDYAAPFGFADLLDGSFVTTGTAFCIGSITKLFTATMLASQVVAGKVQPSDSVTDYLPVRLTCEPSCDLTRVQLWQLATHTSGMPDAAVPSGLFLDQPPSEAIQEFWHNFNPPCQEHTVQPGTWQYSDSGFVTLGFAMVGRPGPPDGRGYTQILADLVTGPLNMSNTTTLDKLERQGTPIATGYINDTEPDKTPGSDLYSTTDDMLKWINASLGSGTSSVITELSQAIALTQQTWYVSPQPHQSNMGLAWQLEKGGNQVIWKNGAAGGYTAWIGLLPSQKLGLAMITNCRGVSPDAFARELLVSLAQPS